MIESILNESTVNLHRANHIIKINATKSMRNAILFFLLFNFLSGSGQSLKFGLHAGTDFTWITTNDAAIYSNRGMMGFSLGTRASFAWRHDWWMIASADLHMNEGGTLTYKQGGNYLPLSELTDPALNHGPQPLQDGTSIQYKLQYWSVLLGIAKSFQIQDDQKLLLEFPSFQISKILRSNGNISKESLIAENENIINDLNKFNIGFSTGLGIEKQFNRNNSVYVTLRYSQGLSDLTKNKGYKSTLILGNNKDNTADLYIQHPDKSNAILHNISLKVGLLF